MSIGLGVLIGMLGGNDESSKAFQSASGKVIASLELSGNQLEFRFEDGSELSLFDDGQSCCERRYMSVDAELGYFVGAQLLDATVKDAPNEEDEWGMHEVQFLEIKTSKGVFVAANHNEHNGYYGGFLLRCQYRSQP